MISCIVPTYNNEDTIEDSLEAIRTASVFCPDDMEIIVSDNGSTDGTLAIIKHIKDIRIVHCVERGIGKNKNHGARQASGDILVFVDADDIVSDYFLLEVDTLARDGLAIGGGIRHVIPERLSLGIATFFTLAAVRCLLSGICIGAFWIRRWVFDHLNGFSEDNSVLEDIDFALRMEKFCKGRMEKTKNLHHSELLWSTRKFDEYGDWYWAEHPYLFVKALWTTKCSPEIQGLWY